MKQCPACGAQNASDVPSCSICGAALGEVASSVAARTLFGMPAVKIDQIEKASEPASPAAPAAPASAPRPPTPAAPAPPSASQSPATRPGFRALGAVELDGSVDGSVSGGMTAGRSAPRPAPELSQTTVGMAAPALSRAKPASAPDLNAAMPDGPKQTLMGAPSPFSESAEAPAPPEAALDDDYKTLLGPPQPIAEAARAREAAKAAAAPQDDYRTLVGAPGAVAEAARARDARRAAEEASQQSVEPAPGVTSGPSIIVDQQAFAESLAAEDGALAVDDASAGEVIVDEPPLKRGVGASVRPMPGDSDSTRGEAPATAEIKRPGGAAERAAAARLAQALADGASGAGGRSSGRLWVLVVVVLVAIALAVWLSRSAYAMDGAAQVEVERSGAVAGPDAPR